MFARLSGISTIALALIVCAAARGGDLAGKRAELDGRVRQALTDAIDAGAAIYNKGDREGCYRVFQGSLVALSPLLDHRPELQKAVRDGLKKAGALASARDRAFALRAVVDEVRDAVGPAQAAKKSLYERLGGEPAITAVVEDLVKRSAGNPKVNFTRKGTPQEWKPTPEAVEQLKKSLVQMVGAVTGGPQKYEGGNMKDVHRGMQITGAEFDALAADLVATLNHFKVPAREQQELLAIIGSTRGDIVEKK